MLPIILKFELNIKKHKMKIEREQYSLNHGVYRIELTDAQLNEIESLLVDEWPIIKIKLYRYSCAQSVKVLGYKTLKEDGKGVILIET